MTTSNALPPIEFGAEDDGFHFHLLGDDWWATETSWFSFHSADRALGGWLYTMARPNIGTVAGGAWVWDDTASLPWEVPYSTNYSALRLPEGADLTNVVLPTGVAIEVLDAGMSYALGYEDPDRLNISLRFDGIMPPEPLIATHSTFGPARHFDQFGHVTGHLDLHGEHIDIDCLAMRDRSWGRRREDRPRQGAYVTGAVTPDHAFLAVTNTTSDADDVAYGFLRRHGLTAPLRHGSRRVERDTSTGWVVHVEIDASDTMGRALNAKGSPVSRIILNRHTFIDVNSLMRWQIDGEVAWGEDQDMWPIHRWSEMRREAGSRVPYNRQAGQLQP
jgi:hypothetical protein